MSKINAVLIAAALLNLGVGAAFAGEDFPERSLASADAAQTVVADTKDAGSSWLLGATSRDTVDVYARFTGAGSTQGGQQ